MMKVDFDLRHKLYGQQGSLWERQVDAPTRDRIRAIVSEAGNAPLLTGLDRVALSTINEERVLVEDTFFRFVDGEFATIGKQQRDYSHRRVTLDDGTQLFVGYRGLSGNSSTEAIPNSLARLPADFLRLIQTSPASLISDQSREWYLVPVPRDIAPVVIQSKLPGDYLVSGIDFLVFDGYIALVDPPADVLPLGVVKICTAYRKTSAANSFVLACPPTQRSNRWVANYTYKTQSIEAYRRAAAEYAGMYVVNTPDVVLNVHTMNETDCVYELAVAGVVRIEYPHKKLSKYQTLQPGHVICAKFDVVCSRRGSDVDSKRQAFSTWNKPISLDGILPVKGLRWDGRQLLVESGGSDPLSNPPLEHTRLMFDGPEEALSKLWYLSARRETATASYFHVAIGSPPLPTSVDFWEILQDFYSDQLALVIADSHGPVINSRLWRFLVEHKPQACNVLLSIDIGTDLPVATGSNGEPLLSENGEYILLGLTNEDTRLLSLVGEVLAVDGNELTHTGSES